MVQQWGEDCILITGGRGGIEAEVDDLALRCEEAGNSSAALEVLQAYVKQKRCVRRTKTGKRSASFLL